MTEASAKVISAKNYADHISKNRVGKQARCKQTACECSEELTKWSTTMPASPTSLWIFANSVLWPATHATLASFQGHTSCETVNQRKRRRKKEIYERMRNMNELKMIVTKSECLLKLVKNDLSCFMIFNCSC